MHHWARFWRLLFRHQTQRNLRRSYRNTSHPCSLLSLFQNRKIKSPSSTSASLLRGGSMLPRCSLRFWKETYIHKRTTEEKKKNKQLEIQICVQKTFLDLYKNMCIWIELFLISPNTVFPLFTLHRYTNKHTLQLCPASPLCRRRRKE